MKKHVLILLLSLFTGLISAQKENEYKKLYPNGNIKEYCTYNKNDKLSGVWKSYYKNGKLEETGTYKNGNRTGKWKFYFENGQLQTKGSFKEGEKIGKWKFYNENGTLEKMIKDIETVIQPTYPECKGTKKELSICFSKKVRRHINRNFKIDSLYDLNLKSGKIKIHVKYAIDINGEVTDIEIKAPHIELEKEARRIIKLLPKMTPGSEDGKPAKFFFALPISYIIP